MKTELKMYTIKNNDTDLLNFYNIVKKHKWREVLHSVKLHSNKINKNRILYGMNTSSIRYRDIVKILEELNFPFNKFPEIESYYYDSFDLGFALDKSSTGELNYRIYFEKNYTVPKMRRAIEKMIETNNDHLFPIIKGIKWNIDSAEKAIVTEYESMVNYDGASLIKRMTDQGAYVPESIKVKLLAAPDDVYISKHYRPLEVYEINTGRHSYDIRFLKNTLYNKELCDTKLQTKFGLNLKELLAEFDEISIGHIATGKDKNGEEFLSIYYLVHI